MVSTPACGDFLFEVLDFEGVVLDGLFDTITPVFGFLVIGLLLFVVRFG